MFIGYQNSKIMLIASTKKELESNFMVFDKIEETAENYTLIDGEYLKDTEAFERLKEAKKAEINTARDEARKTEGAEYKNDIFDIDEVSQSNILAKVVIARITPTMSFIYRSKTNKDHELSSEEIINLGLVIGAKVDEIYKKSWALKALVDNATTKEEIESITW